MKPRPATADVERACREALALHQGGRFGEAEARYRRALALQPTNVFALHQLGILSIQTNRASAAVALLQKAGKIAPTDVGIFINLGLAQSLLGAHGSALASFDRAIGLNPRHAEAFYNRGNAQLAMHELAAAIASFERAVELKPDHAFSYNNRGLALLALGHLDAAIASFDRATAIDPRLAASFFNRADAYRAAQRYEIAIQDYDRALSVSPRYAHALLNRGIALAAMHRYDAATLSFSRAIECDSTNAAAFNNRGLALLKAHDVDAAIVDFERALRLRPGYVEAHYNRGLACLEADQPGAAVADFDAALAADPCFARVRGVRLHAKLAIGDWQSMESDVRELRQRIETGLEHANPYFLLGLVDSAAMHAKAASDWATGCYPTPSASPFRASANLAPGALSGQIRIGYFSADFHDHATLRLMAGLFESHDRNRFEVTLFSYGPDSNDGMRQRLLATGHTFLHVADRSDAEIAQLAISRKIDIAVDLKGYTQDGRPGIFAQRAAPLQLSYLGYPGSLGVSYMDYVIADATVIPPVTADHYTERVIYMPHSYQVNDAQRPISDRHFTRAELGLPDAGFVYCCFNKSFKITPVVFDAWMRILQSVPDCVLWLFASNSSATQNLRREAAQRGIDPQRLVFAPPRPMPEHLARHRAADLFLDTSPYNAHTTASDALWAGLPVLTTRGETFASRVAASLLLAAGVPELIARDLSHYERVAIDLAHSFAHLDALRARLASARTGAPLFDTVTFTRHLETAYMRIHERRLQGLELQSLYVVAP